MEAAQVMEDLVEEILLRFPPEDPASLVRAALVCKGWHRLISNPNFGRMFREFHHCTPPMLGFIYNIEDDDASTAEDHFVSSFVPTLASCQFRGRFVPKSSSSQRPGSSRGWRALDSRDGRVLLHSLPSGNVTVQNMIVWDPVTDEQLELPQLPQDPDPYHWGWNAAVLCALGGSCCHHDCHQGSYHVVFVGCCAEKGVFTRIYSSESGIWSEMATKRHIYGCLRIEPSVLLGNALYFRFFHPLILKYDLSSREMCKIQVLDTIRFQEFVLTMSEDCLKLVAVEDSKLYLWSKEASPTNGSVDRWARSRVVEQVTLLPADALSTSPIVCGFAEALGVIILWTEDGFFAINLKSDQVMKIEYDREDNGRLCNIVPYISFYTPQLRYTSV